jgi:hypothetical protein
MYCKLETNKQAESKLKARATKPSNENTGNLKEMFLFPQNYEGGLSVYRNEKQRCLETKRVLSNQNQCHTPISNKLKGTYSEWCQQP